MLIPEKIGAMIKNARKFNGLTQEELAKKIGISTISIRRYESGERMPDIEIIKRISSACNVNILQELRIHPDILGKMAAMEMEFELTLKEDIGKEYMPYYEIMRSAGYNIFAKSTAFDNTVEYTIKYKQGSEDQISKDVTLEELLSLLQCCKLASDGAIGALVKDFIQQSKL